MQWLIFQKDVSDILSRKRLSVFVDCLMLPLHLCILCAHLWWVYLLSPSPPSGVDCAELKLECIALTLHQKGNGGGKMPQFDELVCCIPRDLIRVVDNKNDCFRKHAPVSVIALFIAKCDKLILFFQKLVQSYLSFSSTTKASTASPLIPQ